MILGEKLRRIISKVKAIYQTKKAVKPESSEPQATEQGTVETTLTPSSTSEDNLMFQAVRTNSLRLEKRFSKAAEEGFVWLLEMQDLWDFHDDDAGVYFVPCKTEAEVRANFGKSHDRVLGIYDIRLPLEGQGVGLMPGEWRAKP
jgi:hypothetical protein